MKHTKNIFISILILSSLFSLDLSKLENCVSYEVSLDRDLYYAGENLYLNIDFKIDEGYHIYSVDPNKSLSPTYNEIIDSLYLNQFDEPIESTPQEKFDESFNKNFSIHKNNFKVIYPLAISEQLKSGNYKIIGNLEYYACDKTMCIPLRDNGYTFDLVITEGEKRLEYVGTESWIDFKYKVLPESNNSELFKKTYDSDFERHIGKGFWSFIAFSFSMGLLALITPCVFPMIPITVSYFTKEGEKEGNNPLFLASVYALGIIGTFTLIGYIFTFMNIDPGFLAANGWVNLFIGLLFVFFAFNLFGYFEIQVPAFIRNYSLNKESKGGIVGILFMSLTFTLVSFTCTAAFIGSALVYRQFGGKFWPLLGMLSFSTAFAFPFFFLALFPQFLSKLPKSGGWLNSVKVIMGFIELAAAFKFFSNTDLDRQWGILSRDPVLAIWAFIFILIGLYVLAIIKMPLDSPIKSISSRRIILSSFSFMFSIYLLSGLSDYVKTNSGWWSGTIESYLPPMLEKYKEEKDKDDKWIIDDLDLAYKKAKENDRPIFIDFTGFACTNCRWMEVNIFTDIEVKKILENNFVLVKLYTDGRSAVHKKNKELEKDRFGTYALPYYVILSPDDRELAAFPGMDTNEQNFINFLNEGYDKFLQTK